MIVCVELPAHYVCFSQSDLFKMYCVVNEKLQKFTYFASFIEHKK